VPVIKANSIRDLKNRVNIHDVVIRVVALKKAGGGRFKGLCPFHSEKTPSFNVSADKGFFKCFGCGKAGDAINFVMETEGLPFTEAVEAIAQRFGFTLEYEEGSGGPSKETRSLRQEIFDIHDLAADFYRHAFLAPTPHGEFIRDYWVKSRRFTPELGDEFKIGFAPVDDTGLAAVMLKRKFSEDALRQCGLFFIRDGAIPMLGNMRPRFRGRLMIPIRDHQGRIVAFTARQLELTPKDDASHEAKYVNSPETPIFTKSNLLFNLDRARSHAGEGHPFVLVEGQLDAMRCWSVGLKTAIAPQGTSITEGQLVLLKRYHPQVECFFDSDSAGQKAALRFLPMALKAGLEVRFLTLAGASKLDPDLLFLEKGLPAYDDVKRGALGAMAFARQTFLPNPSAASFNERMNAVRGMVEIALQAETQVARDQYLQQVSLLLGVQPDAIRSEVAILERRRYAGGKDDAVAPVRAGADSHTKGYEEHLLFICLHHEEVMRELGSSLAHEWIDVSSTAGQLLDKLLAEVLHNGWQGRETLDQLLESEAEKSLAATLLFQTSGDEDWVKIANEGLRHLQKRFLEPKKQQIELEIASKGAIGDPTLPSLLKQRAEIIRQLSNPPRLSLAS
jgi:DNA primase